MASNSTNSILGKKIHTTLNGVKRLIISEVVKAEFSKRRPGRQLEALALYFEGTMGIGKSQATKQAVEMLTEILGVEFGLIDIRLAGMTGSDIQGIPVPAKAKDVYGNQIQLSAAEAEELVLKWLKDTLLPGIAKTCKSHGILFLDELNQVEDNSVKSLLYQLILDKKINDYTIPDGWYIVAAGNREEDGGVYNRLPAPVRDRMMIVEVDLSQDEWLNLYARPFKVHPSVITFIETDTTKKFLHTYDPEKESDGDEECENYVFATPRSWVMVSDEIYAFEDPAINVNIAHKNYGRLTTEADLRTQCGALLGQDMGNKFYQYYIQTRDCDIESIVNYDWSNGAPAKDYNLTPDQLVYLTNIAAFPTDETIDRSIKILLYIIENGASPTSIRIITDSYSPEHNNKLNDFCIDYRCSNAVTQIGEVSARFKEIAAKQH